MEPWPEQVHSGQPPFDEESAERAAREKGRKPTWLSVFFSFCCGMLYVWYFGGLVFSREAGRSAGEHHVGARVNGALTLRDCVCAGARPHPREDRKESRRRTVEVNGG